MAELDWKKAHTNAAGAEYQFGANGQVICRDGYNPTKGSEFNPNRCTAPDTTTSFIRTVAGWLDGKGEAPAGEAKANLTAANPASGLKK